MASNLFNELIAEGEPGIVRLCAERTQESVNLDFKAKGNPTNGGWSDDDKRVFGRALSAFANSAGGLLIFGVDTRKNQDGLDCAQTPVPIADIELFQSGAQTLAGQLLMPRHDGIKLGRIDSVQQPGAGYLLIEVERSERRPHRCEAKADGRYYKRAGDNTFAMEHYDIEDAFRRVSIPTLEMRRTLQGHMKAGHVFHVRMVVSLSNVSRVSARFPYLNLRGLNGLDLAPGAPGLPRASEYDWLSFRGGADHVIHPSQSTTGCTLNFIYERPENGPERLAGRPVRGCEVGFEYQFGCEML